MSGLECTAAPSKWNGSAMSKRCNTYSEHAAFTRIESMLFLLRQTSCWQLPAVQHLFTERVTVSREQQLRCWLTLALAKATDGRMLCSSSMPLHSCVIADDQGVELILSDATKPMLRDEGSSIIGRLSCALAKTHTDALGPCARP
ncbi:hypothetical protein F1559_003340 [Cyanidiococcus yangmingshanensis]|uniref:Uncharacterized protein n=1 Tax=Cyanidiococcus yangmingshanensis TaxID=2690220 RepID=A0A7J7IFR0_9RHOD|nr:hypothetical protein F1559_003340 [Cyanidiococcus yangmingshanensis]